MCTAILQRQPLVLAQHVSQTSTLQRLVAILLVPSLMQCLQGSLPSRMSREGAARTYHMYSYWGYFNRRMSARRALEEGTMPGSKASSGIAFGDNSKQQKSYYGEMTNVWRYFENVPDAISELRTREAAQVADRHLR